MAAQIDQATMDNKIEMAEFAIDGLQCNICLDSAMEPVITLCGHLYCWPCIYKWLNVQQSYDESHQEPQCPICKASVSQSSLVPLYGRNNTRSEFRDLDIPERPAFSLQNLQQSPSSSSHSRNAHLASPSSLQIDEALSVILNPMTCKFGEMVYARIFGSSGADTQSYPYAAFYSHMSSTNPRIRRRENELEKSLNRLSFFIFCGVLLCLFLF